MMVVIEQPRVDVAFAQSRLNGGQVHGQTSIVNKSQDLSESRMNSKANQPASEKVHVGTAAFGCPVERSSTVLNPQDKTECPHARNPQVTSCHPKGSSASSSRAASRMPSL